MVRTSRRRLLVVGGMAALTGCLGDSPSDEATPANSATPAGETTTDGTTTPEPTTTPTGEQSMAEELVTALEPIPASIDETEISSLFVSRPLSEDRRTRMIAMGASVAESLSLERDSVDRVVRAMYGEEYRGLVVIVGSFEADAPSLPDSAGDIATHREQGLFVAGFDSDNESWKAGVDAANTTLDEDDRGVLTDDELKRTLRPVSQADSIIAFPSIPPSEESLFVGTDIDFEGLKSVALGHDFVEDRTLDLRYVGLFESESAVASDPLEALAGDTLNIDGSALQFQRDGRVLIGTGRHELPPVRDREASPNVQFMAEYEGASGTAAITHTGGDDVDPEAVTLLVEDEPVEDAWDTETIQAGDSVELDVEPFTFVAIEWTDPEDEDTYDVLFEEVVASHGMFESDYDPSANEVTFTYTGEQPGRVDHIRIVRREHTNEQGSEPRREPLSDRMESVQPGAEIVVEDVNYGDQVSLRLHYEWNNHASTQSLAYAETDPPGHVRLDQAGTDRRLVFYAESPQPAGDFRVSVGGEPAETQFDDEYSTLAREDTLAIDGEAGDRVVVEFVGGDEPVEILSERLLPPVDFELRRDGEDFELVYTATEGWSAEEFRVRIRGEGDRTKRFDSDTLTEGDTLSIEPPCRWITVEWTGSEDPLRVTSLHVGRLLQFELREAASSTELVFTGSGSWPAEEFRIGTGGETAEDVFSGTVTEGDSATIDISMGEEITVTWVVGEYSQEVFSETVHPELDFEFEYDAADDRLRIASATDHGLEADSLRVFAGGEESRQLPKAWAKQYDTVEAGDAITVDVPSSLEVAVVYHEEWGARAVYEIET